MGIWCPTEEPIQQPHLQLTFNILSRTPMPFFMQDLGMVESYTPKSSLHKGNSLIMFKQEGTHSEPVPATIKYIFTDYLGETFFAVQRFLPIPAGIEDPYSIYPHFPARLYLSSPAVSLDLVCPDWITCQCASYPFSEDYMVILSLSKVGIL